MNSFLVTKTDIIIGQRPFKITDEVIAQTWECYNRLKKYSRGRCWKQQRIYQAFCADENKEVQLGSNNYQIKLAWKSDLHRTTLKQHLALIARWKVARWIAVFTLWHKITRAPCARQRTFYIPLPYSVYIWFASRPLCFLSITFLKKLFVFESRLLLKRRSHFQRYVSFVKYTRFAFKGCIKRWNIKYCVTGY